MAHDGTGKRRDGLSGAGWFGVAVLVLGAALNLGVGELRNPGPGFVPFLGGAVLALLAGALLIAGLRREPRPATKDGAGAGSWHRPVRVAAALLLYGMVLTRLGYLIATLGLMLFLLAEGRARPWRVVAGALLAAGLSYALFHYGLRVPLPRGPLDF